MRTYSHKRIATSANRNTALSFIWEREEDFLFFRDGTVSFIVPLEGSVEITGETTNRATVVKRPQIGLEEYRECIRDPQATGSRHSSKYDGINFFVWPYDLTQFSTSFPRSALLRSQGAVASSAGLSCHPAYFLVLDESNGSIDLFDSLGRLGCLAQEMAAAFNDKRRSRQQPEGCLHSGVRPNLDESYFRFACGKAIRMIEAGELYQLLLSTSVSAPQIYDTLRYVLAAQDHFTTSQFSYWVSYGQTNCFGSSNLVHLTSNEDMVYTQLLASTVSKDEPANRLLHDDRYRAEHVMLVDMDRSDLGMICRPASVTVDSFMQIRDNCSTWCLESQISGRLLGDISPLEAALKLFPRGPVVGAPKVAAQIAINHLEQRSRGLYTGALGYWLPQGRKLRSAYMVNYMSTDKDRILARSGGGITYNSTADKELNEICAKLNGIYSSILSVNHSSIHR